MYEFPVAWLVGWMGVVAVASGATVWWYRGPAQDARGAMSCTGLAALPGIVMLGEHVARMSKEGFAQLPIFSALAVVFTWPLALILFVVGFTLSAIEVERPKGTLLVQGCQLVLWLTSSFVSLMLIGAMV